MPKIRMFLGMFAIILTATLLAVPGAAQAANLTLVPLTTTVDAGRTIEFAGAGFDGRERISVWATAPDQSVLGGEFFIASVDGTVKISVDIPDDAIGGSWAVTAWGRRTKTPVVAHFQVNGRVPAAAENQITVTPSEGTAGTPFVFTASGFRRDEKVSFWVTGPDNTVYSAFPQGDRANSKGEVKITWIAPSTAPKGTSVMTVQGIKSGRARGVPFEIR